MKRTDVHPGALTGAAGARLLTSLSVKCQQYCHTWVKASEGRSCFLVLNLSRLRQEISFQPIEMLQAPGRLNTNHIFSFNYHLKETVHLRKMFFFISIKYKKNAGPVSSVGRALNSVW